MLVKPQAFYALGGLVLVALAFQFFFRYEYVHLAGGHVMRIDRVTSTSCNMPCSPAPAATSPDSDAAVADYGRQSDDEDQEAISIAQATPTASNVVANGGPNYKWSSQQAIPFTAKSIPDISVGTPAFHTRLVCYCDPKGGGWRWEVHTDTRAAYFANDNADLLKKYDLK